MSSSSMYYFFHKGFGKSKVLIIALPLAIILYSFLLSFVLFDNMSFIVPITNMFEILIPVLIGGMLVVQFYLYKRFLMRKEKESLMVEEELDKYKKQIKIFKRNEKKIKKELITEFDIRDNNYSLIKISFLIENELRRIIKKKRIKIRKYAGMRLIARKLSEKEILPDWFELLIGLISRARNMAVHGGKISKKELKNYIEMGKIVLKVLRRTA